MGCRTGLEPATTRITIWGSTIELPTPFDAVVGQTLRVLSCFGKKKISVMVFLDGIFSQKQREAEVEELFVSILESGRAFTRSSIESSGT